MPSTPLLGPVALTTLIARDGAAIARAYCMHMYLHIVDESPLDDGTAAAIGFPKLAGQRSWTLANAADRNWLHIVECPAATPRDNLASYGWLAMEVLVADVDTLARSLSGSPFELLRPPADLDVSDSIRACQARGPAGEILYLTQVRDEVPPFELPVCRAPVDHLFIPVLSTPDRDASLADYASLSGNEGMRFDTRITVVNQARGFELERRHPVATLQLADCALIEIDQIADTRPAPAGISEGMACVAFHCQDNRPGPALSSGPLAGHRAEARTGTAGEHFTLLYR